MYENSTKDILEAQSGNEQMMQQLIEDNTGLIWSIVKRFVGRGHETEDLYQIGVMGFIKAIKRFDTSFEVKLSTYAVPYILGEIKRYIRDDGMIKVSRSIKETAIKIRELQRQHLNKTGQEISIHEIAEQLHIPKEEVAVALDSMNPVGSIYEETKSEDGSAGNLLDRMILSKDETTSLVDKLALSQLIQNLKQQEKQIILLRYFKDKTQMQVAKILGISQVQVSRMEKKILNSMKIKLIS